MSAGEKGNRLFLGALLLSLAIHVSAVTLFRVVFRVTYKDVDYFDVGIVEAAAPVALPAQGDRLSVGNVDLPTATGTPPAIQLPSLRFDQLSMLRMRQEALEARSQIEELLAESGSGAWSSAASSLSAIGQTFTRLATGQRTFEPEAPAPVSRPAPGFEAYIEWSAEPSDRKVLTVVPVEQLWGVSPEALPEPVTLRFSVNRDGRVTGRIIIFSPIDDPKKFAEACANALSRYRFEPLLGDGATLQEGTLIVRAAAGELP